MKRLIRLLTVVQVALAVALAARIAAVSSIEPPQFYDLSPMPSKNVLPPSPAKRRPPAVAVNAIVGGNLFETERGKHEEITVEAPEEPPMPPPATVKLNGVLLLGPDPVAIMTDTAVGPNQRRVRRGDMLGDYEVGSITEGRVTLLGTGGQEFLVDLELNVGAVARHAARTPPRATPARTSARTPARPPARPPARGSAARTSTARAPVPPAAGRTAGDRPMTARERAQAAQARTRAAVAERSAAANRSAAAARSSQPAKPDPVQARLDALRRLREAAKKR